MPVAVGAGLVDGDDGQALGIAVCIGDATPGGDDGRDQIAVRGRIVLSDSSQTHSTTGVQDRCIVKDPNRGPTPHVASHVPSYELRGDVPYQLQLRYRSDRLWPRYISDQRSF